MSFDQSTLPAIAVFSSAVAGCLLLLSWLQHRLVTALALWGIAFLMAAVATALLAARGLIPDALSIVIANALLAAAYGTMWWGVRSFEGRRTRLIFVLTGTLVWLCGCVFPAFYATPVARAVLMTAIGVAYMLFAVFELWRSRKERLASRWPIMGLLAAHAAAIPVRIPLVASRTGSSFHVDLLTFVVFESVFLSICGAFLFGGIVKERNLIWYRQASLIDPLTGVANRRAFFEQGNKLIERSAWARSPAALLLFDLDAFKSINDRFGHAAGDAVLTVFCRVAASQLRPADLLARMGGEEFACLLPGISHQESAWVADRVREAFEATAHAAASGSFAVTVSVGVASSDGHACDLDFLLAEADRALYRAKANGRNRVESGDLPSGFQGGPLSQTA
jgi:diguanylate cyclase (GGDEF)-like protein